MTTYTHIFMSPHFDDAVLSCGGTIHRLKAQGESITVITTMGGLFEGQLPRTPILEDLHQRWQAGENPLKTRQYEDIQALKSLGTDYTHLSLTDCVYRLADNVALYPSEESLFGDVHPDDPAPEFLQQTDLPLSESTRTVYIPLGVGHHVDHQILRDWGIRFAQQSHPYSIKFYAEYPYLNTDNAIDAALDLVNLQLVPHHVTLDESDIQAKVDAIAHYNSQISTFWESLTAMEADVRQSSTHPQTGEYVERFWDIS